MDEKKIVSMLQEFVKDNYDHKELTSMPMDWQSAYNRGIEDGWNDALSNVAEFVGVDLEKEDK